jgi:hypothetical protein
VCLSYLSPSWLLLFVAVAMSVSCSLASLANTVKT